jgi:cell division GTPase FtsZ
MLLKVRVVVGVGRGGGNVINLLMAAVAVGARQRAWRCESACLEV